ncbi:MAG: hypothetical protein FIA92_09095 [Chloroflexi bacterium]|nr:hypothetical protein [Chloroflexota bacterium]
MAPLIPRLVSAITLAVAVASIALARPAVAQDASPTPAPTRGLTCSERFPAEGPAGVDLRLGCIVSELVGLYTASSRDEPPTLSAYVIVLVAGIAAAGLAGALGLRIVARRASRRLAPVLPSEWWVCPSCHSVNPTAASRCYACGGPPGVGPTIPTEDGSEPSTG